MHFCLTKNHSNLPSLRCLPGQPLSPPQVEAGWGEGEISEFVISQQEFWLKLTGVGLIMDLLYLRKLYFNGCVWLYVFYLYNQASPFRAPSVSMIHLILVSQSVGSKLWGWIAGFFDQRINQCESCTTVLNLKNLWKIKGLYTDTPS